MTVVVPKPSPLLGFLGLWLALALALAELGCRAACEEAGLRGAAAAFEARTFEQRQHGFDALAQACPTLPPTLARSLRVEFDGTPVDERTLLYIDRIQDPAWAELFARTCPGTLEANDEALATDEAAMREICRIDRYGLLATDDVFIERDLVVLVLHEWLLATRIDPALARDVAWPLLSASASPEALESMCLREGLACVRVAEGWGLTLPRSSIDVPPRGGTSVRITATELSVDRTPVLALTAGQPAPGAFVQHVAPALQRALAARAGHGRMHAEREHGTPWSPRIELVADRATPFGTIVDVLFTATAAGFHEAELVVLGEGLRAIPLHRPGAEPLPNPQLRHERPLAFTLLVHRDSVEAGADMMSPLRQFPNLPGCEPSSSLCVDRETVAAMSKQLKNLFPHETEVTVRVDDDVPLEVVVALLDAARGEGCDLQPALEGVEVPPECQFFRAIIDAQPPLLFPTRPPAVEEAPR